MGADAEQEEKTRNANAEREAVAGQQEQAVDNWFTQSRTIPLPTGDIRMLLRTLYTIFPHFAPAAKYSVGVNEGNWKVVRKQYMKAIMIVHPDRNHKNRVGLERSVLAESIFKILGGAWDRYE